MDNKKILSLSVLIASIGVFYYFIFFLPNQSEKNNNQVSLKNAQLCQESAMALHRQDGKDADQGQTQMEPRYKYLEKENLCIYKGGFMSADGVYWYLKDVMTNETIASYYGNAQGGDVYGEKKEFDKAVTKYFLGVE